MKAEIKSESDMKAFGAKIGALLMGGEIIELIGDVGAGKTTLTKGIAVAMGIDEDVQSPSFTISRLYDGSGGIQLAHYDFYRLDEPGIMAEELRETIHDPRVVTIIEWAEIARGVLPDDRLTIRMIAPTEHSRLLELRAGGASSQKLLRGLA